MATTCTVTGANLSKSQCKSNYGQIVAFWLDKTSTGVTLEDALLETTWITKIFAENSAKMTILNPTDRVEPTRTQEDPTFMEYNTGKRSKTRNGYLDFVMRYDDLTLCQANKLSVLDGLNIYAYALTSKGYIVAGGTSTQLRPVPVEIFISEPIPQENNDGQWSVMAYIRYIDDTGNFVNAVNPYEDGDFTPLDEDDVIGIEFNSTVGVTATDTVVTTITTECDGIEVDDLTDVSDIIIRIASTGVELTLVSFSNVNNVWTIITDAAALTAVEHEILTKTAVDSTQKKYEYVTVATFTPSA